MNKEKYVEITQKVMSDKTPLQVDIDIMSAWLLVSGLQLTVKHPAVSDIVKSELTEIAHQFQARIVEAHPEAEELLDMGWDEQFDVDEDGEFVNQANEACKHENKTLFGDIADGIYLGCLDCGQTLQTWDRTGNCPDWIPQELHNDVRNGVSIFYVLGDEHE